MIEFLGGDEMAGNKLKADREWTESQYGNGTNEFGFNALPGGGRSCDGGFFNENDRNEGNWWCSSDCSSKGADYKSLSYGSDWVSSIYGGIDKGSGCSVRCVKNSK